MKQSRFIELLNLYVDHQLSTEDARELEAEILRNPARRKTYQQYCRIQKGCTLLFEQERSRAPEHTALGTALAEVDRKVIEFPERRSNVRAYVASIGGLAAAACLAVVLLNRGQPTAPGTSAPQQAPVVAQVAPAESVQPAMAPSTPAPSRVATAARPEFYSVLASRRLPALQSDVHLGTDDSPEAFANYNWMRDVELMPVAALSTDRITLQTDATTTEESRVLRSPRPIHTNTTEINAIQFQR
jgi:anti-sigma factor RsiW